MHVWHPNRTAKLTRCEPVDYLAAVGYWHVLGDNAASVRDEDDPDSEREAMLADHRTVFDALLEHDPQDRGANKDGATWGPWGILWPDRVPGLKTWAGNITMPKLIAKYQRAMTDESLNSAGGDLADIRVSLIGASGLDRAAAGSAIDAGFSLDSLGMAVHQRVATELLAIIGLSTLPLISWGTRDCGWIRENRIWRMTVEHRVKYYYRWGQARVVADITNTGD